MSDEHLKWSLISVKGIAIRNGAVALVRNARDEWDLPGGKLERGETLAECLSREFLEELGIDVTWGSVVDVVHHHVHDNIVVVIVGCGSVSDGVLEISDEHSQVSWFQLDRLNELDIPPLYLQAIRKWCE